MTPVSVDLSDVLFVVGMRREARILGPHRSVRVGASGLAQAIGRRPRRPVVSFGLCGALAPDLSCGALVLATRVVHGGEAYEADPDLLSRLASRLPDALCGAVAGSPHIVGEAGDKADLARSTGALAVDMESHLVACAATDAGAPFAVVRAVSDRATDTLPLAARAGFRSDGAVDVSAVILALARRPWELPALLATAKGADAGFRALARASEAIGAGGARP